MLIAIGNDGLRAREDLTVNDGHEGVVMPHPLLLRVVRARGLEFGARAVVEVVPDVFLISEEFVDGAARPGLANLVEDAISVERGGDLCFRVVLGGEEAIDAAHRCLFMVWPWGEDDAFGLEALAFSPGEGGLGRTQEPPNRTRH